MRQATRVSAWLAVIGGSAAIGFLLWTNRRRIKDQLRSAIKSNLPFPLNKKSVRRSIAKAEEFLDAEQGEQPHGRQEQSAS